MVSRCCNLFKSTLDLVVKLEVSGVWFFSMGGKIHILRNDPTIICISLPLGKVFFNLSK